MSIEASNTSPSAHSPAPDSMPKHYVPVEHEDRIRARWQQARAFAADPARVDRAAPPSLTPGAKKPPFSIFIPPPNVTGALHLGHALNNTLQDILTRYHRMAGYEALWMPGTDHAGIATQAVVERRLRKDGELKGPLKDPARNGGWTRDRFVTKVQEWKDEYEARITNQLKAMGCSCDFDRQRFTMDPVCAAAVREAFFILFRDNLIYRGKRLVNWDPALQTAVADDECYDQEIDAAFYYLRYPLVHASSQDPAIRTGGREDVDPMPITWGELARRGHPDAAKHNPDDQAWVTVATTRPETYLGDTAVGVNPRDPRAKSLRGLFIELPLVGRIIPIIEDDYVVLPKAILQQMIDQGRAEESDMDPKAEFATGFLKVTPAHDQNDWDLGQRHNLEAINVMAPDGSISDKFGWTDIGDGHMFIGKKREDARKLVIKEFETRGLLESTRPYRHSVKHSDRSKAIVEPYLSDQWYVKVTDARMAKAANEALSGNNKSTNQQSSKSENADRLTFHPERYAKTYQQWHDGIRDWCISRQLWWGHRIPVWSKTFPNFAAWSGGFDTPEEELADKITFLEGVEEKLSYTFAAASMPGIELRGNHRDLEKAGEFTVFVCLRDDDATCDLNDGTRVSIADWLEKLGFVRDPDVLDTWFSSALWPLSTLGWPDPAAAEKLNPGVKFQGLLPAFNPSSVLSTAREIITLWVSRMVMMNRYLLPKGWGSEAACLEAEIAEHLDEPGDFDLSKNGKGAGPIPFQDVFIHAVVQDGDGKRMSKSAGNGVDPLDIISSHGADALRFTLCQMTTQTQDVRLPVQKDPKTGQNTSRKFDLGRNFANKLWNAARFVMLMLEPTAAQDAATNVAAAAPIDPKRLAEVDRWMLSRLARGLQQCESAIRNYEFSVYAESCYDLLWRDFCDFYLEAIKPTVASSATQRAVVRTAMETILRLLHPLMPFVTEAVAERLAPLPLTPIRGVTLTSPPQDRLLCLAGWPAFDALLIDERADQAIARLRDLAGAINQARSSANVPPRLKLTLHASENLIRRLDTNAHVIQTLCEIAQIISTPAPAVGSAVTRHDGEELAISGIPAPVKSDSAAEAPGESERDRLTKLRTDAEKKLLNIQGRLSNPGYIAKAPAKLVEESQSQLNALKVEIAELDKRLSAL